MNFLILMGSPRLHGNTAELCKPFIRELEEANAQVRYVTLADKKHSSLPGLLRLPGCQRGIRLRAA